MATKLSRKNPWPKCNALLGSKVMQGSARGQIAQKYSMVTKFGLLFSTVFLPLRQTLLCAQKIAQGTKNIWGWPLIAGLRNGRHTISECKLCVSVVYHVCIVFGVLTLPGKVMMLVAIGFGAPLLWAVLHVFMEPSMGTLNLPSPRVIKDFMPSQCQILKWFDVYKFWVWWIFA